MSPDHAFHSRLAHHRQCPRTVSSRLRSKVNCPGAPLFQLRSTADPIKRLLTVLLSIVSPSRRPLEAFPSFPTLAFIWPSTHANRKGGRIGGHPNERTTRIITTADVVPGQAVQILGLVRGNIVTSKNIGRDIMASAKTLVGGEIKSYTMMTNEARQIAEDRMIEQAAALGADAIVAMRFSESAIVQGTIEMLAYGTAVKFI